MVTNSKSRSRMKRKKPKCYESYRYNVCLGKITRIGALAAKCLRCKWLEREDDE